MVSSKSFAYLREADMGLHKCCKKTSKVLDQTQIQRIHMHEYESLEYEKSARRR
jgi:hypothetical protein